MNIEITDIKIYKTQEYEIFKDLLGNREVKEARARAIIDSIRKIGLKMDPILVNEKYEVIDGQGRIEACRSLGLPIFFIIEQGLGIEECTTMNTKMEVWNIYDFIGSYKAQGNINYIKLDEYKERCNNLELLEVAMCFSDTSWTKNINRPVREGKYIFSETEDNVRCFEFLDRVAGKLKRLKGGSGYYIPVLVPLFKWNLIDEDRMTDAIENHWQIMHSAYDTNTALAELQSVYNYHKRHNEYFRDSFLAKMETEKGARYNSKGGEQ